MLDLVYPQPAGVGIESASDTVRMDSVIEQIAKEDSNETQ